MNLGPHATAPAWGVVLVAATLAAAWDVRTGKIPNLLTLPLFACGLAWSFLADGTGPINALGAAALVGFPFIVLYAMGAGGAGDAKLMAAVGAWLGVADGTVALLAVLAAGAVLGLLLSAVKGRLAKSLSTVGHMGLSILLRLPAAPRRVPTLPSRTDTMLPMPYGVPILAGTCLAAMGVFVWGL